MGILWREKAVDREEASWKSKMRTLCERHCGDGQRTSEDDGEKARFVGIDGSSPLNWYLRNARRIRWQIHNRVSLQNEKRFFQSLSQVAFFTLISIDLVWAEA